MIVSSVVSLYNVFLGLAHMFVVKLWATSIMRCCCGPGRGLGLFGPLLLKAPLSILKLQCLKLHNPKIRVLELQG